MIDYIDTMLKESVPIHQQRNIITHGRISGREARYDDIIEATGFIKKKAVTLVLDQQMLTRLFHDLGHLAGRMQLLLDPRPDDIEEEEKAGEILPLGRSERLLLKDFWSRHVPKTADAQAV